MQWYQEKSGGLVRVWSWGSGRDVVFVAWQIDVALAVGEVEHLALAESPVKRTKRRESGRERLW